MTFSSGPSKFDVVWLHNEKEIKPSKDFLYENDGDTYRLVIAEIFPEDGGSYTCEAFNDVGEAFSSCTLVVVGKSAFHTVLYVHQQRHTCQMFGRKTSRTWSRGPDLFFS